MRYFPEIPLRFPQKLELISKSKSYQPINIYQNKITCFEFKRSFHRLYLINWIPICDKYFLEGSFLEKCGIIWKNCHFSGRVRLYWEKTHGPLWPAMAELSVNRVNDVV